MKHLKKTPAILLLMLLTVIIGSWTFPQRFFGWYLFDKAQHADRANAVGVRQDRVHISAGYVQAVKSITVNPTTTNTVEPVTNILFQSKDGGQTWQDISQSLPEYELPEGFAAGESGLYLRVNDEMYHSKSNLKTPVWEKENVPDLKSTSSKGWPSTSIVVTRSGVIAFNYEGEIYQKIPATETWLPIHTNFKKHSMRSIFETSDGTVFLGYDHGLYRSIDKGKNWKHVQNEGLFMDMVESGGVLIATGAKGIMRSADNGEHWEWVISEGGVGIAVECIDGGFAAITYNSRMKSRRIRISMDSGKTWTAIDEGLQPSMNISSIKQIGKYLLCGHPDGIFRSADMGQTWNLVHPSVDNAFKISANTWNPVPSRDDRKVFKIYVSDSVLYAVARNAGC